LLFRVLHIDFGGVAAQLDIGLNLLEPATGLEGQIHLPIERVPVADGAMQVADMDEVEGAGLKGPVLLSIVDLKAQVWRDPAWLRW